MKTLIRDALPTLAEYHPEVQQRLVSFTKEFLSESGGVSAKTLAAILTHAEQPRTAVIEAYVRDLTGSSLQSADELDRVCRAFGVDEPDLRQRVKGLRAAFIARNEIIHELDFTPEGRLSRRTRRIWEMADWASAVLDVGQRIVDAVSGSLEAGKAHESESG